MKDDREREQIQMEATHWVEVLATASPAQRVEFLSWARQSSVHVHEFLLAVGCDDVLQKSVLEALSFDRPVNSGAIEPEPPKPQLVQRLWLAAPLWRVVIPLAAVVLFTVLTVLISGQPDLTIQTSSSQWHKQSLSDGSSLTLAPGTRLTVALDERQRLIELVRGGALFEVEKDPARRPFIVVADSTRVRATGTSFEVARQNSELIVTVEEGEVVVERDDVVPPAAKRATVAAGQQVTVSAEGMDVRAVNIQRALARMRHQVVYRHASVAHAVAESNSRNRIQIELDDPQLGAQPIMGVFDAYDPASLAELIATDNLSEVSKRGDVLHIKAASQPRETGERP